MGYKLVHLKGPRTSLVVQGLRLCFQGRDASGPGSRAAWCGKKKTKKHTKLKVTLFLNIYTCIIFVYTLRYQQCFSLHGGIRVISFFLASVII